MNDIRRTILWVIFGFSMVLLWDQWQVYNGNKATFFPSPTKAVATAGAPAGASSVPSSSVPTSNATTPASSLPGVPTAPAAAPAPAAEKIVVLTDQLKVTFDTQGGSIVRTEFLRQLSDDKKSNMVLLDEAPGHRYVAESGLIGGDFPNHKTLMTFSGDKELKDGANQLVARFESPEKNGVKLVKIYTLRRGAFDIGVRYEVANTGTSPVTPQVYMQLVRDATQLNQNSSFLNPTATYTGPAVFTQEKKYQKVEFKDIDKGKAETGKAEFLEKANDGYIAMVQHYFASAWILGDGVPREYFMRKIDGAQYSAGLISTLPPIAAGATGSLDAKFFAGPQEETKLEVIAPDLERVKDYGYFHIIAKPLYWLLAKLHGYIGNWGWSIMALVLLIKIAFYWLQAKGYQSMAKMKAINPRVMAMRERFKDKPQEMQQEMMKIYREEKVNPMGGCLPIIVQIPVFIALYWVLLSSVEMRGTPWVGWIHDLSAPDPLYILPLVMTLTTLLQTALNPTPPDPMQAKMMWLMPLAFSVMFFFFPAGLVLYWITNNVLSIAQQWMINTRMGVPPEFNLPKFR
ncbi:MAG: membrane protein insertase YidC [Ramlibacter sp.]|nr:membrane protein insertase YidC [Ramlibacter sp.]